MKTIIKIACFLWCIQGGAQVKPQKLFVDILITNRVGETLKGVYMEDNELNKIRLKKGKFLLKVQEKKDLMVTFKKEGYTPKTIWINTQTGTIKSRNNSFGIKLVMNDEEEQIDATLFNFPIAKICYNTDQGEYAYDKMYNLKMRKKYQDLLKQLGNNKQF